MTKPALTLRDLVNAVEGDNRDRLFTLAMTYAVQLGYRCGDEWFAPGLVVSGEDAEIITDLIRHTDADGVYRGDTPVAAIPRKYRLVEEGGMYRVISTGMKGLPREGGRGGLVDSPLNLSHQGLAWIGQGAQVRKQARVDGDAMVDGSAQLWGRALVTGDAYVDGDSRLHGNVYVGGRACVRGGAELRDRVTVLGNALIRDATLSGDVVVDLSGSPCGDYSLWDDAVILASQDTISLSPTLWGPLVVAATVEGHVVQVGCQRFALDDLAEVARRHTSDPLTRAMVPGFVAMMRPVVDEWATRRDARVAAVARARAVRDGVA